METGSAVLLLVRQHKLGLDIGCDYRRSVVGVSLLPLERERYL